MAFFTVIEAFEKFLFVLKWSNHTIHYIKYV